MFRPFEILQYMSEYAGRGLIDLAGSAVPHLALGEFMTLAGIDPDALMGIVMTSPPGRGSPELRARVAALYPGAGPENVLVTLGATEATRIAAETLLEPGDEAVVITPCYRQLRGTALNAGIALREVPLVEERGWALDLDALQAAVGPRTKLIQVVNPHNPTGRVLDDTETGAILAAAARHGAWVIADEVYAGSERGGRPPTPTLWGRYERVLAVSSFSKASGLAGLRTGWLVAPEEMIPALWRRHEYLGICGARLGNLLAEAALEPRVRAALLARGRKVAESGFGIVEEDLLGNTFSAVPPQASVVSLVRFGLPVTSEELAARIRARGALVVPGSVFGAEGFVRIGCAAAPDELRAGLLVVRAVAEEIRAG